MKNLMAGLLVVFASSACASAQAPADPCRLNEANVPRALTLGYADFLAKDPTFQAVWSEWMNAGTAVTRMETEHIDGADIRRRADADLQYREMRLKSNLLLQQVELDKICGQVIQLRVAQAGNDRLRPHEISLLQQATSALRKKAALGAAEFRTLYNKETDGLLAESKEPQRATARISSEIKAATALRDSLRSAVEAK